MERYIVRKSSCGRTALCQTRSRQRPRNSRKQSGSLNGRFGRKAVLRQCQRWRHKRPLPTLTTSGSRHVDKCTCLIHELEIVSAGRVMFDINKNLIIVCVCALMVVIGAGVLSKYNIDSEFASPVMTKTHTIAVTRNFRTRYLEPKIALLMYGGLGTCVIFGVLFAYHAEKLRVCPRSF